MTCRYPHCTRQARRGWTTCHRHYSAGKSTTQTKDKK